MSQLEAVSSSWSTKLGAMIWTAVPIWAKRAASYRTCGLIRATLGALGLGQLHQLSFPGLVGAVISSCSTPIIRTAVPVGFRAASTRAPGIVRATSTKPAPVRAGGLVRATLRGLGHQLGLFVLNLETTGQCHKGKDHCQNFHLGQCTVFSPQN